MKSLMLLLLIIGLSGCVHPVVFKEWDHKPYVETVVKSKEVVAEHDITITTTEAPIKVTVTSFSVPVDHVEDRTVIIHEKWITTCGVMDYFPRYFPLRILIDLDDYKCQLGGTDYVREPRVENTDTRTVRHERMSTAVDGSVRVLLNGKEQTVITLNNGTALIDPYEFLLEFWPNSVNELCIEHKGQKGCGKISPERMDALIKSTPQFPLLLSMKERMYNKCIDKDDVLSCNWAGTLFSLSTPAEMRLTKKSYFRSCLLSEENHGCSQAAVYGATNEVNDIMAWRSIVAEAENDSKYSRSKADSAERAAQREQDRLERAEQRAEERRRQQQESLYDSEFRQTIIDSVKNATDQINNTANGLRNMR